MVFKGVLLLFDVLLLLLFCTLQATVLFLSVLLLDRATYPSCCEIVERLASVLVTLMEALSSAMASSAGAPLRGGQQGLEDCHRRMDLINAARKLRGLPVRLAEIVCVGPCGIAGSVTMWVACEPDILTIHRCIDQVRDYQNNPKAFARDVLRFEIALEGVKFLRSLEYAPRDAALTTQTTAPVPTPTCPIAAATPPAVTAVSSPTQHLEDNRTNSTPAEAAASRGGFCTASAGVLLAAASAGSRFC